MAKKSFNLFQKCTRFIDTVDFNHHKLFSIHFIGQKNAMMFTYMHLLVLAMTVLLSIFYEPPLLFHNSSPQFSHKHTRFNRFECNFFVTFSKASNPSCSISIYKFYVEIVQCFIKKKLHDYIGICTMFFIQTAK